MINLHDKELGMRVFVSLIVLKVVNNYHQLKINLFVQFVNRYIRVVGVMVFVPPVPGLIVWSVWGSVGSFALRLKASPKVPSEHPRLTLCHH